MKIFNFKKTPEQPSQTGLLRFDSSIEPIANYDLSSPYINPYGRGKQYIYFGSDNLYPYNLLDMFHGSPIHSSLIEFKTRSIFANGLDIQAKGTTLEENIKIEKIKKLFNRRFIRNIIQEHLIHNRVCLSLRKKGENANDIELIGAERVRTNYEGNAFWVAKHWKYSPSNLDVYAAYDKNDIINKDQMFVYQTNTPGIDLYTLPSYTAASNWIYLDSQIAYYQKQNILNSVFPSAIIKFYENKFPTKEKKQEFINGLQNSFASAKNAGKVMTFFSNGKEVAPEITMAEANKLDKAFSMVQENIIKNVAYAHNVDPVLIGISQTGKLGNSQDIANAYALYNRIFLENAQDDIEDILNTIVEMVGINGIKVKIKRTSDWLPVSEK